MRKARVLYIDGEMPRDLMQERIKLACEWFDINPPEARYLSLLSREDFENMPPFDSEEGQRMARRVCRRQRPVRLHHLRQHHVAVFGEYEGRR